MSSKISTVREESNENRKRHTLGSLRGDLRMEEKSIYGEKTRKPVPPSKLTRCPVNYYQCEKCSNDDAAGCCPIRSSCMCSGGHLDVCETI